MQKKENIIKEDTNDLSEITQEDIDAIDYSKIENIADKVDVIKVSDITKSQLRKIKKGFDCGIKEYNTFLQYAKRYDDLNISKTRLLVDKETNKLIAYMSLNSDTIRLEDEEKEENNLNKVPFKTIPALKIGKLATNKDDAGKGYGTFLIEIAYLIAEKLNEIGVACRFVTVDADIQYNETTDEYYKHLGFVVNESLEYNEQLRERHLVSMRKDIMIDSDEVEMHIEDEKQLI